MRKRVGIYGVTDEALGLIPLLTANPGIEIVCSFDDDPDALAARLEHVDPDVAALVERTFTARAEEFVSDPTLSAVIGADPDSDFHDRFPEVAARGVQVVTVLAARMLWGYAAAGLSAPRSTEAMAGPPSEPLRTPDAANPPRPLPPSRDERNDAILGSLHQVVELTDPGLSSDELFGRMLEIALRANEADGGSLMLVDPDMGDLRVRAAAGIEPELWPSIRLRLRDGIAGKVAEERRPLLLCGPADPKRYRIARERHEVESALCVPLIHQNEVLGVLSLHTISRPDAFTERDLEFAQELAQLDARIIARAQEHERLGRQARRFEAAQQVHGIMMGRGALPERLAKLCQRVAERVAGGIVNVYELDEGGESLRLTASSLQAANAELRVPLGRGIDGAAAARREPVFLWQQNAGFYAALPLVAGGALAGLITIQSASAALRDRGLEQTLGEIASVTGRELGRARHESRRTRRAHQAAACDEAGIRMISTTDPAELLRLGTSEASRVLDAAHAVLRLRDDESRRFTIRSYSGSATGHVREQLFRLDKHASLEVLERARTLRAPEPTGDPALASADFAARSLIAAPLYRDGRIIGTLAVYDALADERVQPGTFDEADVQLFSRFRGHMERALANALLYSRERQERNFDEARGLLNASRFAQRLGEEIARASVRRGELALATARIENLLEIEQRSDPVKARKIVERVVVALRTRSRSFDVLGRMAGNEFMVIIPDAGPEASDCVFELVRAVAEDVSKDEPLNESVRIALAFGYASYPEDGSAADELIERARELRIRMV